MDLISILENKIGSLDVADYEIYAVESEQFGAESKEGEIEFSEEAVERGVAIRLWKGGRAGFASSSDWREASLGRAVQLAYDGLLLVEEQPRFALPSSAKFPPGHTPADSSSKEVKREMAVALEREARGYDRRITRVRDVGYSEQVRKVTLKNSQGLCGEYSRARYSLSLMVMAEEKGDQQMAWEDDFSDRFDQLDPTRVAHRAAEKAIAQLGARPVATQKTPALLDPVVGSSFLGVLSSSFLGDQVQKNRSVLAGRLGQEIYARGVKIVDDGNLEGGYETAPFDGEGVPAQRSALVRDGVLQKFLYDSSSAGRVPTASTGNARRLTIKEPPRVGPTNFFIVPGEGSLEELLQELGTGFWIRDLIGVHTADPVTGDFSLGASGVWIEKGERRHAVRGVTISGNLHELMKSVVRVGGELRFYHSYGSPPLLVRSIDLGGT